MRLQSAVSVRVSYQAVVATLGLCAVIYLYYAGGSLAQLLAIALFLGVLYLWTNTIESFEDFSLKKEKWGLNIAVGIILGLFMFILYVAYKKFPLSTIAFNASIVVAVVVVAAAEEFFFRGYLQGKLSRDFNIIPRIVVVTILFGLYKVSVFSSMRTFMSLAQIVVISCIGSVILSLEMERMQNLLAPVISHVLWDTLVYSNMESIPSWIVITPTWTETLYDYIFRFCGFFCGQWDLASYFVAGKQFVTCSGCTGIFLGVFIAFFLFDKNLFARLHTKKFYVPALLPQICMFFGLNIAHFTGVLDSYALGSVQLQIIKYCYTTFGLLLGFSGSVLMINAIGTNEKWGDRIKSLLDKYEYLMIPALLLAFLANPLSNIHMAALIFFSILVVLGIITTVVFLVILFTSVIKR